MAEEKQTEEMSVNDTLNADDTSMLRAVLHCANSRGIAPVSVYRQAEFDEAGE